ncbi:putative RTA1 domain protein [Lasiosphaeria hispida]|uniref:RTA1 domain protein n=1 Tax=Lasiosphaeria hispida TaxID=260671 RepID=A0AAJ0H7L9_9PEZI|nr:putative RTA1 domain protein [Lasiosphaeria hispida]
MADGEPVPGSLFIYAPNKVAPAVFSALFAISGVGHIWQCYHYKCFKLVGLHSLCAIVFAAGYALREYATFDLNYIYSTKNLLIFIISQVFIFICPPLLELANYHVLGRVFYYVPYNAPLPPGRVLSIFGGLLAIVELLNSLGVAFTANISSTPSKQEMGKSLTLAALAIQLVVIVIFVVLASIFHWRCAKAKLRSKAVSTSLTALYISMALIFVRCIYRLVEHLGNTTVRLKDLESLKQLSPILRYEWYFYVFEAVLMLVNSVLWNVWNPGRYLPGNHQVYLSRDGIEVQGEEGADRRPLLAKAGHVLTFGIFFGRKKESSPFEELHDYPGAK